ncbi:MAG: peptidyl-prolyl cis-trans isomerase [Candidatus Krumholzibacteriia bacterium]
MWFQRVVSVLWIALLLTVSCSKSHDEMIVAKVKDRTISVADFERTYLRVDPKFLPESSDLEGRKEFLDTMIEKEIMALKADELGYDKDQYVVEGMKAFKKVGLQAGYLKIKVADKLEPTEAELKESYKKYGTTLQVKQILVDTEEEAQRVYDILQQGHDFETVCREYSKGPDAEDGGKIVNALYGTFPPRFQEELFSTKVGDVTHPILSQYGYFVIKVVRENQPPQKPFEEERDNLAKLVRMQKQLRLTQDMSENIRARHGFEWYEENIKSMFDYLPADRPLTNPPDRSTEVYPLLRVSPQDLDKPLVAYKGKFITMKDFSDLYDRASFFQRPRRESRLGDIKKFLVDIVMNELIALELEESGIENEPQVKRMLQRKQEQLMVDKLYQDLVDQQTDVGRAELDRYYNDNLEQFRQSEERRFGVILCGSRADAQTAHRRLSRGIPFEQVASQFNVEELSSEIQAEDRFLTKGEQPELDEHGFSLKNVGDYTEPFETSRGWLVLKLYERRPERILPLSEAQHDIRHYLKTLANEERLKELLLKWREEIPIAINEKNLKKAQLDQRPARGVRFN